MNANTKLVVLRQAYILERKSYISNHVERRHIYINHVAIQKKRDNFATGVLVSHLIDNYQN